MKLIDILVQELPKLGGWPDGVTKISQDYDGEIWCWRGNDYGIVKSYGRISEIADNHRKQGKDENRDCFVSREQYEAALAASKPEWDGDGLPPVGCRVEANFGGEWVEATVAYTDRPDAHGDAVAWKEALVFDCKTTRPFWADEFRPIRSEEDRKRAECVIALARIDPQAMPFEYGDKHSDGSLIGPFWYELYDAIAAGKIPHIRID